MSKADKNGWIRHRGGKCPVDVRYRDGYVRMVVAGDMRWSHIKTGGDIMRHRLHKPAEQPDPEADAKAAAQAAINPIEWRDRIHEIDRTIEALEEERVSLIQQLADEGLQLLQGKVCGSVQPVEDMSDWRNWKAGDLVQCQTTEYEKIYTCEWLYEVSDVDSVRAFVFDDLGDGSRCSLDDTSAGNFKWHSRPAR